MTALEKVSADIAQARGSIRAALAFVNSISTQDDAADAYDRVKLAKEWAKIRKIHTTMHRDLLRLEMHCLRKIGQIGARGVLRGQVQSVAQWLANKTDAEVEQLIKDYGHNVTPTGVMQRAFKDEAYTKGQLHVTSGAYLHQDAQYEEPDIAEAAKKYSRDITAALATLIEECELNGNEVTVWELGSMVFSMLDADDKSFDWGVRKAMNDLCRKAMTEAVERVIPDTEVPRFITCIDRSVPDAAGDNNFVRVPFVAANLRQLADMVEIRYQQAEASKRAYQRVRELYESLSSVERPDDHLPTLGELAMRLASSLARAS